MIETEPRPPVRAIVASFLFTDLVGFSKGSASEQYIAKAALSACLRSNLAVLRETDYWIKDTGDGALIAFVSNPEHALYMALAIAQDYGQAAEGSGIPFNGLRTGLHLGTVKETVDLEARRNYIGDGINATKRIMDFAAPGQIAASRNFFEAVANLDAEYAALFQHVGASDDKHGRAHELYAVAPSAEVLRRLKLDLTASAPRPAASEDKGAATIGVKRDPAAAATTKSPTQSNRSADAFRIGFKPLIALIVLVAMGASIFWITGRLGPAAPTVEPVTTRSNTEPASTKAPGSSGTAEGVPVAPPAPATAIVPRSDERAPVRTTRATQDPAPSGPAPGIAAPEPAAITNADAAPRASASTTTTVRVPVVPDRGSTRCSRIVEKAALGEPLSEEEKRELANSCR